MLSILAGMMIALGGIVYLSVGEIAGSLFFSMGLLTILCLRLELFTGKAGLLATNELSFGKLLYIWAGNFIGTAIIALLLALTPKGFELADKAIVIVATRISNGPIVNMVYGVFCGLLMFMAVKTWSLTNGKPAYAMMPVAIFILCGFNHCIADMFYLHISNTAIQNYHILIPTTIGNLIGCNIIPWAISQSSS